MKPIAIFYHCLFVGGDPLRILPAAQDIVKGQMDIARSVGLLDACQHFCAGINGSFESIVFAETYLPGAQCVYHGLDSKNENLTIAELEKWLAHHPGWNVLYFHSKGATHEPGDKLRTNWRQCMMRATVRNWRTCVQDLESGYEAVGCHWMTGNKTPPGQSLFAGTFWWATSDYLRTLPSIYARDRIKLSGIGHPDSRYECEVWIGNGPQLPKVKDYHPAWIDQCQGD